MRITRRSDGGWQVSAGLITWAVLGWLALPFIVAGLLLAGAVWLVWQIIIMVELAVIAAAAIIRRLRS